MTTPSARKTRSKSLSRINDKDKTNPGEETTFSRGERHPPDEPLDQDLHPHEHDLHPRERDEHSHQRERDEHPPHLNREYDGIQNDQNDWNFGNNNIGMDGAGNNMGMGMLNMWQMMQQQMIQQQRQGEMMHQQMLQQQQQMMANVVKLIETQHSKAPSGPNVAAQSEENVISTLDFMYQRSVGPKLSALVNMSKDEKTSISSLKTNLQSMLQASAKFETYMMENHGIITEDRVVNVDEWYSEKMNDVYEVENQIHTIIEKKEKAKKEADELDRSGALPHNVEIPKLYQPDEFPYYWQKFEHLVHNNPKVSKYWKLQYLIQGMKGEVKTVLDCIPPLTENYKSAVELLQTRFGHPRKIVRNAVKALVNTPLAQNEAKSLRKNYDQTLSKYRTIITYKDKLRDPLDAVILPLVESKLPPELREEWERKLIDEETEFSSVEDYFTWVGSEVLAKEVIQDEKKTYRPAPYKQDERKWTPSSAHALPTGAETSESRKEKNHRYFCEYCVRDGHTIQICRKFKILKPYERYEFAKDKFLCYACLTPMREESHGGRRCNKECTKCEKPHHDLLHYESPSKPSDDDNDDAKSTTSTPVSCPSYESVDGFLPTAKATLKYGSVQKTVTIAFDTMSEKTFITKDILERTGKNMENLDNAESISLDVHGFGNEKACLKTTEASFKLLPLGGDSAVEVKFRAVVKDGPICAPLPPVNINMKKFEHLKNLKLADEFPRPKSSIDILIGIDWFFKFIKDDIIRAKNGDNLPVAMSSIFGYVLMGPYTTNKSRKKTSLVAIHELTKDNEELKMNIERLWSLEAMGISDKKEKPWTEEQRSAVDQFEENICHDGERYQTIVPRRKNAPVLVSNYKHAYGNLKSLEKRHMNESPEIMEPYDNAIMEYPELGFAREETEEEIEEFSKGEEYFHPHKEVIRKAALTTKTRAVFNPNGKDENGNCLNDCIIPGPGLQPDIGKMHIRQRCRKVALMADIAKMFCQEKVDPSSFKFQQFLWRNYDQSKPPRRYVMTRLMFGVSASPFLAMATINHHITRPDMLELYENACKAVLDNIYVDDVCAGGNEEDEVIKLAKELILLFKKGGWKLTKFLSNSDKVMESIPEEDRLTTYRKDFEEKDGNDGTTKVLGLAWNAKTDVFTFTPSEDLLKNRVIETKRSVVSRAGQIYDVLGFVAAFSIRAKINIQKLWSEKVDWDDELEGEILVSHKQWCEELSKLGDMLIPRYVLGEDPVRVELHGFGDASKDAYGAAVYVRVTQKNGEILSNLLMAKAKVAPLKQKSIPRLELLAAHILVKLMEYVLDAMEVKVDDVKYWSDSEIVLAWLAKPSTKWKTFVANRVQDIHDLSDPKDWHHVASEDNPADLLSRGISLEELKKSNLYWHGPEWLVKPEEEWPQKPELGNVELLSEESRTAETKTLVTMTKPEDEVEELPLIKRREKYITIIKIVARMRRWKTLAAKKAQKKKNPEVEIVDLPEQLAAQELKDAELGLLRAVQWRSYPKEVQKLEKGEKISSKSKILQLDPQYDKERKILVIGGRLRFSTLTKESKNQIILPGDDLFVQKMVLHIHQTNSHAPMESTLCITRSKYWITHGRRSVNKIVRSCLICRHYSTKPVSQKMGDLPHHRVEQADSFVHVGLDFTGPVYIVDATGKTHPAYICIFTCAVSRMVHLELCNNMKTEEFLLALRRLLNRRGKCNTLESDNQKTFKKADKLLQLAFSRKLAEKLDQEKIQKYLTENGINWQFITERSPFRGGYWERLNRSLKEPLRKILGQSLLNYTEMYTVMTDIEAMINSRPLTYVSTDPQDPSPITPAHLAIGRELIEVPDIPVDRQTTVSKRYRFLQTLRAKFWTRWSREYLITLQERPVWRQENPALEIGDVCLITEEKTKRNTWPMGVVVEIKPSKDNLVRTVSLKTKKGIFVRPVQRLHLFEKNVPVDVTKLNTKPAEPKVQMKKDNDKANKNSTTEPNDKKNNRLKPKLNTKPNIESDANETEAVYTTRHGRLSKKPSYYGIKKMK